MTMRQKVYVPEYAETIKRLQAAAGKEVLPMPGLGKEDLYDPKNLLVEGIIDRAEAIEASEKMHKMAILQKQYEDELKMELQCAPYTSLSSASVPAAVEDTGTGEESLPDLQQIAEDAANMSKVVMPHKKRRLYKAMQIGKESKPAHVDILKERKRKFDGSQEIRLNLESLRKFS